MATATHLKFAAAFCPLWKDDSLENKPEEARIKVLLTQRVFWNHKKDEPMSFPGKWVFPGGKSNGPRETAKQTSIREFREETGYQGNIEQIRRVTELRIYEPVKSVEYRLQFFKGFIDPTEPLQPNKEVLACAWNTLGIWSSKLMHDPRDSGLYGSTTKRVIDTILQNEMSGRYAHLEY